MTETPGDWTTYQQQLAARLAALGADDVLVLGIGSQPERYVQAVAGPEGLVVECSGPADRGGPAALSAQQQVDLQAMGWVPPSGGRDDYPNYRATAEPTEAAALLVATLRGPLEATGPEDVDAGDGGGGDGRGGGGRRSGGGWFSRVFGR